MKILIMANSLLISIGTNDIRHCRGEGVAKYKGELFRLTRYIKEIFPSTRIFYQSLFPLPITNASGIYTQTNEALVFLLGSILNAYIVDILTR